MIAVVDTSVVSILFRDGNDAFFYSQQLSGRRLVVSFQTIEELWFGAFKDGWGEKRKNELVRHLESYEVVWPNDQIVNICAKLRSEREKAGRRLNTADAWIAATPIYLDCPLASHDRDFSGIPDLTLIQHP